MNSPKTPQMKKELIYWAGNFFSRFDIVHQSYAGVSKNRGFSPKMDG